MPLQRIRKKTRPRPLNAEQLFKLNAAVCAVGLLCSGNVLAQTTQTWTGASNDFTLDSN